MDKIDMMEIDFENRKKEFQETLKNYNFVLNAGNSIARSNSNYFCFDYKNIKSKGRLHKSILRIYLNKKTGKVYGFLAIINPTERKIYKFNSIKKLIDILKKAKWLNGWSWRSKKLSFWFDKRAV